MATKPAPKPEPKPARKSEPRPAPKLAFRTAPRPAPIDLVRNPNFDAAMAQQDYANLMRDQQARLAAQRGQFTQGRLMGGPERQSQQAFQDEIARRNTLLGYNNQTYGSYVNQPAQQGFGDVAGTMSSAGQLPSQQQFNPNAPSLMPIQTGGSMIGNIGDQRNIYNNLQPYVSEVGTVPMRNPENPNQMNFGQIPQQQMQNYQNFLQQGIQNSNTLNQGAMNNFANMQPRMQATPARQMPSMPVAGMGMQQPKQTPPRKFSTVNTPSARLV